MRDAKQQHVAALARADELYEEGEFARAAAIRLEAADWARVNPSAWRTKWGRLDFELSCRIAAGVALQEDPDSLDAARDVFQDCLPLCRALGDAEREGRTLSDLGEIEFSLERLDVALGLYQAAATCFRSAHRFDLVANARINIAAELLEAGARPEAREWFERALSAVRQRRWLLFGRRRVRDPELEARILVGKAQASESLEESLAVLREAEALVKSSNQGAFQSRDEALGHIYRTRGNSLARSGEHAQAVEFLDAAAKRLGRSGHPDHAASALRAAAETLIVSGRSEDAEDRLRRVMLLPLNREQRAAAISDTGVALDRLGHRGEARKKYEDALLILGPDGSGDVYRSFRATILHNLALCQFDAGERDKAVTTLRESLSFKRDGAALASLGSVLREVEGPRSVLPVLEEALAMARKEHDLETQASAHSRLGLCFVELQTINVDAKSFNAKVAAGHHFREAVSIWTQIGDRSALVTGHANLAGLYWDYDDVAAARRHFETAVGLIEALRGEIAAHDSRISFFATNADIYRGFAEFLVDVGQRVDQKLSWIQEAFRVAQRGKARGLLDALGEAQREVAARLVPDLAKRERELWAAVAEVDARLGVLARELPELKRSFALSAEGTLPEGARRLVAEREREQADLRSRLNGLTREQRGLAREIRRNYPGYAVLTQAGALTAEEARERLVGPESALLEYLCSEREVLLFCITASDFEAYRLPVEMGDLEQMIRELRAALRMELPAYPHGRELYEALIGPAEEQLKGKTELLICADGVLCYLPFPLLLSADPDPRHATVKSRHWEGEMDPGVTESRDGGPVPARASAKDLTIIGREDVSRAIRAVGERDWRSRWGELPYLFKGIGREPRPITLRYSSTARIAGHSRAKASESDRRYEARLLALAYPAAALGSSNLPAAEGAALETSQEIVEPIPHTVDEVWDIAALLAPDQTQLPLEHERHDAYDAHGIVLLSNSAATKRALLEHAAHSHQYLHIATHGHLNNERPGLSGLLLAGSDGQADYWQAHEIIRESLPCQLVTLSCCDTALGPNPPGEGIIGLARAFQQAGAHSVCATLWRVPDLPTRTLMVHLYRDLAEGQHPARALMHAQHRMLDTHPNNWAALTIWE